MMAVMENIYDQLFRQDLLKKNKILKQRIETALKSFIYSFLDFRTDQRQITVLRSLRKDVWF